MDDFRKILYGVIIGFIAIIVGWVSFLTYSGCGFSLDNCNASVPKIQRTSIPSLVPATLPAPVRFLVSTATASATATATATTAPTESAAADSVNDHFSNSCICVADKHFSSCRICNDLNTSYRIGFWRAASIQSRWTGRCGELTGDPNSGQQIFAANCVLCHNTAGKGGNPNPGSRALEQFPALNPINRARKFGSYDVCNEFLSVRPAWFTPAGPGPTFSMPPWGDKNVLSQQQIADVIAYLISLNP